MRRWYAVGLTAVSAVTYVAMLASSVDAESPILQSWWTERHVAVDTAAPTLIPNTGPTPVVTIPSDDVPDGGSDVAGTESRPVGLLTLRYEFPTGSVVGELQLRVYDEVPPTPGTSLSACPLAGDGSFRSVPGGGPMSRAPAFDCGRRSEGRFDDEAGIWRFGVADFVDGDHLALAIVPVAGRAVFERVRSESLEVRRPASTPPPGRPPARAPSVAMPVPSPGPSIVIPTVPRVAPAPAPAPDAAAPARPPTPMFTVVDYDGRPEPIGSAAMGSLAVLAGALLTWRRGRRALLAMPRRGAVGAASLVD